MCCNEVDYALLAIRYVIMLSLMPNGVDNKARAIAFSKACESLGVLPNETILNKLLEFLKYQKTIMQDYAKGI
jgi:hypothetical protein